MGAQPSYGQDWIAPAAPEPSVAPLDAPVPASPWPRRRRWIGRGVAALLLILILLIAWLAITAPLSKSLEPIAPPRLTLLAADGTPIAQNGAIIADPVKVAKLPPHVKQAFLAIEDRRFDSHWGVDPRGLLRATWSNLRGSGPKQGGSTITQQLAKITFLTPERNLSRKAREMLIAFWLESWLTKDEILERYLSNVYFGENIYGLRAASLHYYYRQPEKLTLSQAAMLAGLVQAPSRLAPTRNPKAAAKRARMVLNAMVATGAITSATAAATRAPTLDRRIRPTLPTGTYFADWAMPEARDQIDLGYGAQTVKTTLDTRLQRIARDVVGRAPLGRAQVALVAMRTNGEVVAMIGGRSYSASTFNRVTQARRQPGSTFKLFVYLAALRGGMTPDSLVDNSPITEGPYRPRNAAERYGKPLPLRQAFAQSSNVAAVRLYRQMGDKAVVRAARDMGIRSPLAADPSLALGTSGVTLLELTSAYAAVAAGRWPVAPHALSQEEPGLIASLFGPQRRMGSDVQAQLEALLAACISEGTGRAARLRIPAYGKTGTSQDSRDALFVGYAEDLIVGVWIGNDDNAPLKGVNGGGLPARIWRDFMGRAIKGAAPVVAPKPVPPREDTPPGSDRFPIGIDDADVDLSGDGTVTLNANISGIPLDVRIGRDGIAVEPGKGAGPQGESRPRPEP